MATLVFASGAEAGIAITGASSSPDARVWTVVTGTPTIETTTVRSGVKSFKFDTVAGTAFFTKGNVINGGTLLVGVIFLRFSALPDVGVGNHIIVQVTLGVGANMNIRHQSGSWGAGFAGGTFQTGPSISVDTWYRIDFRLDVSANPNTIDWQVDGSAQTQAAIAQAATTITNYRVGVQTSATATLFADDLACSLTTGDYPIGDISIVGISPNVDGTHSFNANDFEYNDTTAILTSATDVNTFLDETSLNDITDFISQNVINSVGYVEMGFANPSQTHDAMAVEVVSCQHASAAGGNTCTLKLNDGGTLSDVYALADFSNTSATFNSKCFATAPSGGAWTQSKLNALLARWGYATDVVGIPYLDNIRLEVVYGPAPAGGWGPLLDFERNRLVQVA